MKTCSHKPLCICAYRRFIHQSQNRKHPDLCQQKLIVVHPCNGIVLSQRQDEFRELDVEQKKPDTKKVHSSRSHALHIPLEEAKLTYGDRSP